MSKFNYTILLNSRTNKRTKNIGLYWPGQNEPVNKVSEVAIIN